MKELTVNMQILLDARSNRRRSWVPLLGIVILPGFIAALGLGCSSRQTTFATADDAAQALVAALRADDTKQLKAILGRGAGDILSSGDEVADRAGRERFLEDYDEKHALVSDSDGTVSIEVGAEAWPMPIPIVRRRDAWRFDTAAGKDEILNRRIGRNELDAMQVCLAIVDAQKEYFSMDPDGDGVREYARKFRSDPGTRNGLYWHAGEGEAQSPLGPLAATASSEGYAKSRDPGNEPRPYRGYLYRILTAQGSNAPGGKRDYVVNGRMTGGFAVVAWPAEHGNSGVMTFLVNHNGLIFQRNLGRRTDRVAREMTTFDPGPEWELVQPPS